jgi:hypothetical protein
MRTNIVKKLSAETTIPCFPCIWQYLLFGLMMRDPMNSMGTYPMAASNRSSEGIFDVGFASAFGASVLASAGAASGAFAAGVASGAGAAVVAAGAGVAGVVAGVGAAGVVAGVGAAGAAAGVFCGVSSVNMLNGVRRYSPSF